MNVRVHDVEHARDAGPTQVNVQDADLRDTLATSGIIITLCFFEIFPESFLDANTYLASPHSSPFYRPA